jgi:uncharacterized protein
MDTVSGAGSSSTRSQGSETGRSGVSEALRNTRFWEHTALAEMSEAEWEAVCDGCGRCCLHKLEDADTGEVHYTDIACKLLDIGRCRCSNYLARSQLIPDCVPLTVEALPEMHWLPLSCGYRRLAEGRALAWWHPLVSGSADTVHQAGVSVRGKALSEVRINPADITRRLVAWPADNGCGPEEQPWGT